MAREMTDVELTIADIWANREHIKSIAIVAQFDNEKVDGWMVKGSPDLVDGMTTLSEMIISQ